MKLIKKLNIVFLSTIILLLVFSSTINVQADAGEERTVYLSATEYDYPPFSVTDSGEADGFSVDLLKAVAEEMGIEVTFKIDQWTVLKEELKNGELDILPLVGYTEERDEVYDFTVPYIVMRGNIFVRKGDDSIQSQADLFGKDILVLDGDNSQEWAWSIGLDSELTATTTYLEAFELLSSGQYDAVLAQGLVGEKLISDHKIDNVEPVYVYDDGGVTRQKLNLEGYEQKFCFAVVEGDAELLSILNEGLSIVSVNGTYDELYQKWFPFLLENDGVTTAEIMRYLVYILTPILVILVTAYFITTKRTIKIRTAEIREEKERSEKYLHELVLSGKIFESSIENAPIPIMIHAEDGTVLNISKTWTTLTGYDKKDIPTIYDWTEKAYGAKKEEVRQFIEKLYTLTSTQYDGEYEVNTSDGSIRIWDFYSMHIGDLSDGRAVAMSVATDITKRVQVDKLLKDSEERFKILHNASFGGITIHDQGLILECNQGLSDITGYTMDELIGMDGLLLIAPDYRDFVMSKITSGYEKPYEAFGIRKSKEIYPLRLEAKNLPYKGKQVRVVEFRDITEQKKNEKALIESEQRLNMFFQQALTGFFIMMLDEPIYWNDTVDKEEMLDYIFDHQRCTKVNEALLKQYDIEENEFLDRTPREIFSHNIEQGKDAWRSMLDNGFIHLITDERKSDGTQMFIEGDYICMYDSLGRFIGHFGNQEDVTTRIQSENEIKYLSEHDHLTDLHNRRYYFMQLETVNKIENYPLGIMMVDINGLKIINDAFGHSVGDQALMMISDVLKETFKDEGVVARIGGDEFAILLTNAPVEKCQSYKDQLKNVIENRKIKNIELSLAIGFAIKNDINEQFDDIIKEAENKMYRPKITEGSSVRNRAINAILETLTDKYEVERNHSYKVSHLCKQVGEKLNIEGEELKELEQAGLFHDIGKISIPDDILSKPGKLTAEEYEVIKTHTEVGYQILKAADEYSDLAIHALHHQERWDGKGYPSGLQGTEIPLFSRIIGVVDAFEAMTADRPYRDAMTFDSAIKELQRCSGTQFDPKLVDVFVNDVLLKNKSNDLTAKSK